MEAIGPKLGVCRFFPALLLLLLSPSLISGERSIMGQTFRVRSGLSFSKGRLMHGVDLNRAGSPLPYTMLSRSAAKIGRNRASLPRLRGAGTAPGANLGEMFASLFTNEGPGTNTFTGIELDTLPPPNTKVAPDWGELEDLVKGFIESDEELAQLREEDSIAPERREVAQSRATLRLFDAPDGMDPDIVLYRDSASWCPYCEKVWMMLEEKRIPYRVEFVPMSSYGRKPESFLRIQPSGAIPVAIIDGKVFPESNDIMSEIEDRYPSHTAMIPMRSTPEGQMFQPMLKLERRLFSAWFGYLVTGFGEKDFLQAADETDKMLEKFDGPYFLGKNISLVDCMFAPFLERMAASLPYYKGIVFRGNQRWQNINRWFEAMEERPSFRGIQSDYYTHVHDLPPQIGGCRFSGDYESYLNEIDGTDDHSWVLPLSDEGGVEPVRLADRNQKLQRIAAVKALVSRHEPVVKFAARAMGESGRGVSAPFSDPYRQTEPRVIPYVDLALRIVSKAMLMGPEATANVLEMIKQSDLPRKETATCLMYLRDRIGVPRDMTFAQARQLRAYLNLVVDNL